MCDYSLMAFPNRLAREGEELITHRFSSGCLGLASPGDLERAQCPLSGQTFWAALKEFFNPKTEPVPAVCIPPGARLQLQGLPMRVRREFGVEAIEEVTFTQLSASVNSYRDAVRFLSGRELRIQELGEGLHVKVLDLSLAEDFDFEPIREERAQYSLRI